MTKYGPFKYEKTLGDRNYKATATATAFVQDTLKRMNALVLAATQDLIDEVQTPVAKGGKMRVDTGFLRASGQMSLTGIPAGPSIGKKRTANDKEGSILYEAPSDASAKLSGWKMGMPIWFGWTAAYAKYREAYDGFLISGLQNWPAIVARNCAKIQARSPAGRQQQ